MKLAELALDFETTFLDLWDGTAWLPKAIAGSFQVYDRFITERTFGVKKRIFLTSHDPADTTEVVRTPDGIICLVEAAVPDYENDVRFRCSMTLRETNAMLTVTSHTPIVNAAGVATGQTPGATRTTWCDVGRYNSNLSGEFSGVYHETDIIVLPYSFSVSLSDYMAVDGVEYKVAEIDKLLRLREVRGRRG